MLSMRPNCECCGCDLSPETGRAFICSFECTYCEACATGTLGGACPNCGGELALRPRRPAALLLKYPGSTERIVKAGGCARPA